MAECMRQQKEYIMYKKLMREIRKIEEFINVL